MRNQVPLVREKRDNPKIEYRFCPSGPASDALAAEILYNRIVISDANVMARFDKGCWSVEVLKTNIYTIDIYMSVQEILRNYGVTDVRMNVLKFIMMINMQQHALPNDELLFVILNVLFCPL